MPRYIRADLQNKCSFHSSHTIVCTPVMKMAGIHSDKSTSVSALGGSWATRIHSRRLVMASLGYITSA